MFYTFEIPYKSGSIAIDKYLKKYGKKIQPTLLNQKYLERHQYHGMYGKGVKKFL